MLYYLHGYLSGPNSAKGKLLQEQLGAIPIEYNQGSPENVKVDEALALIAEALLNDPQPILIGSSFGGFLAAEATLQSDLIKTIILLNPAIIPADVDTRALSGMPRCLLQRMQDRRLFGVKMKAKVFILMGTRDEVIPSDWVLGFAKAQQATIRFLDDDHAFAGKISLLPGIIREILH